MADTTRQNVSFSNSIELRTVLLVDDDARLLRGLKRVLAEQDYTVVTAVSAAEAHAIVKSRQIDLILCDNLMTGTLGTEFLAEIRDEYPDIILMMLSGYLPGDTAERLKETIGIVRVLTKPSSAVAIANAIREELERPRDEVTTPSES